MSNTDFNLAWITARLNQIDSSKRFLPLANSGGMRNFSSERPDAIMQTFDAGGQAFIRDSVRTNKFFLTGNAGSFEYNKVINNFRCKQYGVYIIDRQQNIAGVLSSTVGNCGTCNCNSGYGNTGVACSPAMADPYNLIWVALYADDGTRNGISLNSDNTAYLYPIPVDQESVYAKLMFNNAKDTIQGNMVVFDFDPAFVDSSLSIIPCSSFTDWIPSMIKGLVNVCPVFSVIDQTAFTVQLETSSGTAVQKTLAQGWVDADFTLRNTTDNANVTFTSIESETMPGEYLFTMPSQTLGDQMLLTASKQGFDATCFASTPFAIPNS